MLNLSSGLVYMLTVQQDGEQVDQCALGYGAVAGQERRHCRKGFTKVEVHDVLIDLHQNSGHVISLTYGFENRPLYQVDDLNLQLDRTRCLTCHPENSGLEIVSS